MKKLLAKIFGSSDTTKAVVSGIDKAWFTDEEKSEYFLKYLAATQPQNLARRLIAVIVVLLWALLIVSGVIAYSISPDYGLFIFDTVNESVNTPFSIIIGFYFAAHLARAWQNGKEK